MTADDSQGLVDSRGASTRPSSELGMEDTIAVPPVGDREPSHPIAFARGEPDSDVGARLREARVRQKIFGKPSEAIQIGRFRLLEQIGLGGMGEVFSAYDDQLDRKVAIKLVRTDVATSGEAHERLLKEARILAKVAHPNIVAVHEVGSFMDRVFIAMEFVRGVTLGEHVATLCDLPGPARVQAILKLYMAAGEGLQSAHDKGLVHRDFKPANAILGEDRRVRVLDFGLARDVGVVQGVASDDVARLADLSSNTATGEVLGTPQYMAPEQFLGQKVDHRSDQFSYCVALFEALYGQPPFTGSSFVSLRDAVLGGQVTVPARKSEIPASVHKALLRGLERQPDQRFDNMAALLDELKSVRRRRRTRRLAAIIGIVALVAATTAVAIMSMVRVPERPACTGGAEKLSRIWGEEQRDAIETTLTRGGSIYAANVAKRVLGQLSSYRDQWVTMHESACREHHRGNHSAELLDRRMACLEQSRVALVHTVAVLEQTTRNSLSEAVRVSQSLPSLGHCADVVALLAQTPPPRDPRVALAVEEIRERLTLVTALRVSGATGQALERARQAVADAQPLSYPPVMAEAWLSYGRVLLDRRAVRQAVEFFRKASDLSLEHGLDALAVESLARLVYAEGTSGGSSRMGVLRYVDIADAISRRLSPTSGQRWFVRGLLHNNAGVVHLVNADVPRARAAFQKALTESESHPDGLGNPPELLLVRSNLSRLIEDPFERADMLERAVGAFESYLGDAHPYTLEAKTLRALHLVQPDEAREAMDEICNSYQHHHPESTITPLLCLYQRAYLDAELGDDQRAAERLARFAELGIRTERRWPALAHAWSLLLRGHDQRAVDEFRELVTTPIASWLGENIDWWVGWDMARAYLGLAQGELALGRPHVAIPALERAVDLFTRAGENSYRTDLHRARITTGVLLAQNLWDTRANRPRSAADMNRIAELIATARGFYGPFEGNFDQQIAELTRLERALASARPARVKP